ncbi:MAG: helix-turn-helix transcriptional regulator [Planctomycetota bacterium]|jgi:excisionase family DNA binding protein
MEWPAAENLLRVREAAKILGVCERTLRTRIAARKFPVVRVSPGRLGVDPRALERYIKRQREGGA